MPFDLETKKKYADNSKDLYKLTNPLEKCPKPVRIAVVVAALAYLLFYGAGQVILFMLPFIWAYFAYKSHRLKSNSERNKDFSEGILPSISDSIIQGGINILNATIGSAILYAKRKL